jgi:hypothetical protein
MALFFLQGFRTAGFRLEEATMHWLGAAPSYCGYWLLLEKHFVSAA